MTDRSKDIRAASIPVLTWDPASRTASLQALVNHSAERAEEVTEWYLDAKRAKRVWAMSLRFFAILMTAAAGILPILQQIYSSPNAPPAIQPAWASVLVALAVLLIGLDRFFGFSSAWIRYITADLQLKQAREAFEIDWQAALASYGANPPSDEQVRAAIALIRAFVEQVNGIVLTETSKWVAEFQEALRQAEEAAKAPLASPPLGSVTVTVENGDTVDPPGWGLSLDHAVAVVRTGKTAAFTGLTPTDHHIRVEAKIAGRTVLAEAVVSVKAGAIAAVAVTLA